MPGNCQERRRYEPIAIVGLGCRFAGGIDSPDALWEVLVEGRDLVTEVPADRWDVRQAYDPEPGVPGKSVSKWGAFLEDVTGFDPEAFGMSEREVEAMDPQHRLLLETSWEALEQAGLPPVDLQGSMTGVFFGVSGQDFMMQTPYRELLTNPYSMTGNARSMAAGRVSYLLGLRGPSIVLDTACSSSLVAAHLAAQSLQTGDCNLALAGGVNLIFGSETTVAFSSWGMLSPAGRCRAFDAEASGFVRAEACAVVTLKRLTDAERDGDRVLAVLRGSGVNQDGRSNGITSPSGDAQQDLQRRVIDGAGIDPSRVGLIEAHGTGTPVGDPIEFAALSASYGTGSQPCALGSVKTNLGHAETASGMAGLFKAVMALRHGLVPPNLHFRKWNDEIAPGNSRLFVPTKLTPWPVQDGPRLAAVSSYGFSGTNAHVLVEQARYEVPEVDAASDEPNVVPVSASSTDALRASARRIADWLARQPAHLFGDVGYTLARRRTHRGARAAVVACDMAELVHRLRVVAVGEPGPGVSTAVAPAAMSPVWVFCGQGSQWAGMGRTLLKHEAAFAAVIDELEPLVAAESGFSLRRALESPDVVTGIDRVQPVLFAVQVALAALWRGYGVEPAAVIGHSMGEVAATVVAGALSLADGAGVICRRSRLMAELSGAGAMASVDLPAPDVERELSDAGIADTVIAVHASPTSTVVSGDTRRVRHLVSEWDRRGQLAREIAVDVASHSPQVDPILARLVQQLRDIEPSTPTVPFYSTVCDDPRFDAAYWSDNLRRPVRFADAVAAAVSDGHRLFVEVSPHPLLTHAVRETAAQQSREVVTLPTLRRQEDERLTFLTNLGAAYCAGAPLDWSRLYSSGRLADVPLPVWNHRPLLELGSSSTPPAMGHPLLGLHVLVPDSDGEHLWQSDVGTRTHQWLAEHRVRESPALPAAAFGEMALSAGRHVFGPDRATEVVDLRFDNLLLVEEEGEDVFTSVVERGRDEAALEILTRHEDGDVTIHARALLRAYDAAPSGPERVDVGTLLDRHPEPFDPERFYAHLRDLGVRHGPNFAALARLHRAGAEGDTIVSEVRLPAQRRADSTSYVTHPVLLDACLQTLAAHPAMMDQSGLYLPLGIGTLRVIGDVSAGRFCLGRLHDVGDRRGVGDFQLLTNEGAVVMEGRDVRFGTAASEDVRQLHELRLLTVEWEKVPPPPSQEETGAWILVAESAGEEFASSVAAAIESRGGEAKVLLHPLGPAHDPQVRRSVSEALGRGEVRGVVVANPPGPGDEEDGEGEIAELAGHRVARLVAVVQGVTDHVAEAPPQVGVVTHMAQPVTAGDVNLGQSPLRGVTRVIGHEHPELRARTIDVAGADPTAIAGELLDGPADEDEVAWRGSDRYLARLRNTPFSERERRVTAAELGRDGVAVQAACKGDLDTLELAARPRRAPGPGEVEVEIRAASLNYVDALNAMGLYRTVDDNPPPLGADCAGVVARVGRDVSRFRVGDRVAAMMWGGLASHLTVSANNVIAVPEQLSFEEAATMPAVYLTAWYALDHIARLQPGERVLIHSATGGVGQAALAIATARGAEVFATAGTEAKRNLLRALGIQHVASSRTLDFAEEFRAATGGEGVDVVLNSLVGPAQRAGLDLLRTGGRFLEIGKRDIYAGHRLSLSPFRHNITFASIDLGLVVTRLERLTATLLEGLGGEIAAGRLRPLPHTLHELEGLSDAFRTLASGRHTGKLVVRIPQEGIRRVPVPPEEVPVVRPDGAYAITGGLGGLGLLLARWLADSGAGRIVLNGRTAPRPDAGQALGELREGGADVRVVLGDVAEPGTAGRLLREATEDGLPLRGLVHGAAVIEDAVVTRLDSSTLERVWRPKAIGAWRLHRALQDGGHEPGLDWWLLFSSAATLIGNPGQSAYAGANGWLDGLAVYRRSRGFAATSVNWGAWAEHGRGAAMADRGFAMIPPHEGIDACDRILRFDRIRTGYLPIRDSGWLEVVGPRAGSSSFFAAFAGTSSGSGDNGEVDAELLAELGAADEGTRRDLLTDFLVHNAASILRVDPATIEPSRPLLDYGLDSLMGLELRTRIATKLGVRVPTKVLWSNPQPAGLADHLVRALVQVR